MIGAMAGQPGPPFPDSTWRLLAERSSDALFVFDDGLRILWVNPSGQALLRFGLDALRGRRIDELFDDAEVELARLPLQLDAVRRGEPVTVVRPFRTADGRRILVEAVVTDLGEGHILGVARDITARATAEERLARSEASFRALIENTPDGVVVHDQGRAVYVNAALARMLGHHDPAALLGVPVVEHVHPDDRAAVTDRLRRLYAGEANVPFTEERLIRKDGGVVTASIGGVRVEFGGRPCVAAIARDVSEQRRLQARLVEADRLVALGTLSAGIAHEVNNPLTYLMLHQEAIVSGLERLRAMVPPEAQATIERIADNVAVARDGAERVRHIVRDLKIFARTADDARAPTDVRVAIRRALVIAGHELRDQITVETDLRDVPRVLASDGRLTQVFLNLIINAAHAVAERAPDERRLTIRAWTEPDGDGAVKISIHDTGTGIAPEHLPRLFEPFFTTKPVGEGSGLGLSVAHGIVTSLGGSIEVRSAPGAGTTFTITLPAAPA
jgi:PAS domain S-box-containing protein